MSLLSIGFLSEAINERGIIKPNEIFNYVRERLVSSIGDEEQKDGFDGILICFDKKNNSITYSAAHNAPVLVSDGKLTKLPYNKMPVGRGELKIPFELHRVEAKTGDTLYLFTDGYSDQFGGPQKELGGKKFKQKMLNELLLKNSDLSLKEQKEKAENHFNVWKGDLEQVDDITIIGIKI